ncbi:hypothetical protein N7509_008695 [Penicillium cosmopolitanum]|uniref:Uncharacterized protein n=1 Tax=Penicillium cosmopolitanum TaxID=1131564 RepID=A0A9W9VN52_9EURO|nr:uncharacterized protein N7509_008695 [Penicillium cosmopolitanum]KAJ5386154.1 hypothetical protein N7509_008695 [Penicillium cosmopolitanum]
MSLLGKKFPGLLGKPMTPFFAAGTLPIYYSSMPPCPGSEYGLNIRSLVLADEPARAIVLYGVNSLQNVLSNTAEFKNDPRNPNAKSGNAGH